MHQVNMLLSFLYTNICLLYLLKVKVVQKKLIFLFCSSQSSKNKAKAKGLLVAPVFSIFERLLFFWTLFSKNSDRLWEYDGKFFYNTLYLGSTFPSKHQLNLNLYAFSHKSIVCQYWHTNIPLLCKEDIFMFNMIFLSM